MSKLLQVRIEFPGQNQDGPTPQMIADSVRAIFVDVGIDEDTVSKGIDAVSLKKTTPLGVDPGTAAVLVALIGMGVELIKLGFELRKHDDDLAIRKRELALKELNDHQSPKGTSDDERKLLEEFVSRVLLVKLMEQHNIQPINVHIHIEER